MPSKQKIHPWLQPIKKITDPLKRIIKRESKRIYIPGFQDVNLYQVVTFFIKQLNTLGLYDRAAAISFNLIMALPAAFLFLFSIIPYFPKAFKVKKQILTLFKDIAPNSSTYKLIVDIILYKKYNGPVNKFNWWPVVTVKVFEFAKTSIFCLYLQRTKLLAPNQYL